MTVTHVGAMRPCPQMYLQLVCKLFLSDATIPPANSLMTSLNNGNGSMFCTNPPGNEDHCYRFGPNKFTEVCPWHDAQQKMPVLPILADHFRTSPLRPLTTLDGLHGPIGTDSQNCACFKSKPKYCHSAVGNYRGGKICM